MQKCTYFKFVFVHVHIHVQTYPPFPTTQVLFTCWVAFYTTTNSYHWLLGDKTFLQSRGRTRNTL